MCAVQLPEQLAAHPSPSPDAQMNGRSKLENKQKATILFWYNCDREGQWYTGFVTGVMFCHEMEFAVDFLKYCALLGL